MSESPRSRRETLPRSARIRSQRVFRQAFEQRCRVSDRWLTLFAVSNDVGFARLGISIGTRFGPAVKRNRTKRLIREAFRRIRLDLPSGLDLIIVPRPGPEEPTVGELQTSIRQLCCKAMARLGRP